MKPAAINLEGDREIYQGDDYELAIILYATDGVTPQNLTSWSAPKAQIRSTAGAPTTLADFTCTVGNQTTNPGLITLTLSSTTTAGISATVNTNYVWDFEIVDASSKKATWAAGTVAVIAQVTRG